MKHSTFQILAALLINVAMATFSASAKASEPVDSLIEAAWACHPAIVEEGIVFSINGAIRDYQNAGYSDDVTKLRFNVSVQRISPNGKGSMTYDRFKTSALELKCPEANYDKLDLRDPELRGNFVETFLNRYVTIDWTVSGMFKDSVFKGTVSEFRPSLKKNYNNITYKISFNPEYYSRLKAIDELELQQKQLAEEKAAAKQAEAEAAKQSLAPRNLDKLCNLIQGNEVYVKFSKLVGDAVRSGIADINTPTFELQPDKLLSQWYEKNPYVRFKNGYNVNSNMNILGINERANTIYSTADKNAIAIAQLSNAFDAGDDMRVRARTREQLLAALNSCFDEIISTDLAYIFVPSKKLAALRDVYNIAKNNPTENKRVVTASGEVIEHAEENPLFAEYKKYREEFLLDSAPHWLTLVYGGENVLKMSGEDYLVRAKADIDNIKKEVAANKGGLSKGNKPGKSKETGGAGSVIRL